MNNKIKTDLVAIWQSLHDELRMFFVRRLPNETLADDLLQETFLRLQEQEQKIDEVERLDSWVYRIARNLLVDYYRREQNSPIKSSDLETDNAATKPESAENHNQHLGRWLRDAIERLPVSYREALRMYELESMSQQAIADNLQISLSAAKSRIQRGRSRLKQLLMQCCSLETDSRGNIVDYQQVGTECNSDCCD